MENTLMTAPLTAVVYHSGYGHNEVIARAVARGAETVGPAALVRIGPEGRIADEDWKTLDAASAIVFGAPTYMGSASGPFKVFADATSKVWMTQGWKDKVAGGFTTSHSLSGDKVATLQQLAVLASQQGMIWVSLGLLPAQQSDAPHQRAEDAINRVGSSLGAMAQAENAAPDVTPPAGDVKTGELYGARIAAIAKKLKSA
jgi:NAD(P)H dehydrogenase (quinone)